MEKRFEPQVNVGLPGDRAIDMLKIPRKERLDGQRQQLGRISGLTFDDLQEIQKVSWNERYLRGDNLR